MNQNMLLFAAVYMLPTLLRVLFRFILAS